MSDLDMLNQQSAPQADQLATLNGHASEGAESPSMDDIWSSGIDKDQIQKNQADMLLDAGGYETVPPLTREMKVDEKTKRPFARFFGQIIRKATANDVRAGKAKAEGEILSRGSIGFALSPVRFDAVDRKTGEVLLPRKPDSMTKRYTEAVTAFKVAYGREATTVQEVLDYLRDFAVKLRVIQVGVPTERNPEPDGEPGNIVMNVSAIREQK